MEQYQLVRDYVQEINNGEKIGREGGYKNLRDLSEC